MSHIKNIICYEDALEKLEEELGREPTEEEITDYISGYFDHICSQEERETND